MPDKLPAKVLYLTTRTGGVTIPSIRARSEKFNQDVTITPVISPMWLDTCETARAMIENALVQKENRLLDLLVASASTISIQDSGPLTMVNSNDIEPAQYATQVASRLMGRGDKTILGGEMAIGSALYLPFQRKGMMSEIKVPFELEAFESEEEVKQYFRYVGQLAIIQGETILSELAANGNHLDDRIAGIWGNLIRNYKLVEHTSRFNDEETDVEAGIEVSQQFPGGIYFPALIALGKLRTERGRSLQTRSDVEVGRFLNLTNNDTAQTINKLIAIVNGAPIKHEVVYERDEWSKVYMEGRRQVYSLHEFFQFEQEQLKRSTQEIWTDESLPPKTRRKLVMQKLGIEMSPHIYIPKDIFFRDSQQILQELCSMWHMNVGASSAYFNEPPLSRTPSFKFTQDATVAKRAQEIAQYLQKLDGFTRAVPDSRDVVELYPSIWDDENKVVGGVTRFDTRPQMGSDQTASNWVMEMQRGVWPRGLDPAKGEFVTLRHTPHFQITDDLWVQVGSNTGIERKSFNANDTEILPIAEREALRYTQSFAIRDAIRHIMDLRGNDGPIGLEWRYFEPDGRILAIDISEPLDKPLI